MDMQNTCRFRRTCTPPPDALTLLLYYCVLDTQFSLLQEEGGFSSNIQRTCVTYFLYGKISVQLFLFHWRIRRRTLKISGIYIRETKSCFKDIW
jgi:hypothetical protein